MIVKLNKNQFDYLSYSLSEEQEVLRLKLQVRKENNFVFLDIDDDGYWRMQRVGSEFNSEYNCYDLTVEALNF